MDTISIPCLSSKLQTMSESATIKMAQEARNLRSQGHDVISLSLGEPDFDTPEHIKAAAAQALKDGYTKYTPVPGLLELREAIISKLARDNDLHYGTDDIVVSNGAKQCIANVCLSLLDPSDEVVIFAPYWVSYFEIVKFCGGIPKVVSADIETDFKVSSVALADAISPRTKLIIFSSPCNPTGSVYLKHELEAIAKVILHKENLYILSDEIYEYINFTDGHESIGALPGMDERTITVNGMSKGFAMTGWRLGYMAAPRWISKACAKVQGQFTSGATSFGQKAAAIALSSSLQETHRMKEAFLRRRDLFVNELRKIPRLLVNVPQGAFYVFPDIKAYFGTTDGNKVINNADDFAQIMLQDALVAIVSGSAFGNDNCVRLSYAASDELLVEAASRIKDVLMKFT